MAEGVVQCLHPMNSFILLGVMNDVCANFGENPSRNASVRVHTDGRGKRQTGFIICPMLYAIAVRQIKNFFLFICSVTAAYSLLD